MAIEFSYEVSEEILYVKAWGSDRDLNQVKSFGTAVISLAKANKIRKILSDERELEYTLGVVDLYELAEYYSKKIPFVVKVAVVCKPEDLADAKFWETTSLNRGLNVHVFTDIDAAKEWISHNN